MTPFPSLSHFTVGDLSQIRESQKLMASGEEWQRMSPEDQQTEQRSLQQAEQKATHYLTLAGSTIHLLHYITTEIVEPFLTEAFAGRMAQLLDYYIAKLVQPKDFKVDNAEQYNFKPRELLAEIVGIFIHLGGQESFVQAVANVRIIRPQCCEEACDEWRFTSPRVF
jgi:ubiquitin conjugation factor E4 B